MHLISRAVDAPVGALHLRVLREWRSTLDPVTWPAPPNGDGRPAILVPGFLAGDPSLSRMARWLKSGGFPLSRSGITWNVSCMEPIVAALEARLEEAVQRAGNPAVMVGQSRGGSIGRVLAVRRPELVDTLVTLGSPVLDQLAVHRLPRVSIGLVGALGTLGVRGMFGLSCVRGECCARSREELLAPFPEDVRFVALYSRRDEVVKWRACLDPSAECVEVTSSHIGMGLDIDVWRVLRSVLADGSRAATGQGPVADGGAEDAFSRAVA